MKLNLFLLFSGNVYVMLGWGPAELGKDLQELKV